MLENRLAGPGFADKAPAHVVQQARDGLRDLQEQLKVVVAGIDALLQQD